MQPSYFTILTFHQNLLEIHKYHFNGLLYNLCLVFAVVDLLQVMDMRTAAHYNVSATEDGRGCPAYQIGQYATLVLPTAKVFGPL